MPGYKALGKRESPRVRVLTKDACISQVTDGVFRWDHNDENRADDARFRAIERHPELGSTNYSL